jgi:hypothetical protein
MASTAVSRFVNSPSLSFFSVGRRRSSADNRYKKVPSLPQHERTKAAASSRNAPCEVRRETTTDSHFWRRGLSHSNRARAGEDNDVNFSRRIACVKSH